MKGSHSRLLQVVVAAMLINVAPDGRAETYDLRGIRVTPPPDDYPEGADFVTDYNWDYDDRSEPSGSDGDDSDDSDDDSEEADEEKQAKCDAIAAKVPSSCDLKNPPLLTTNGCGGGIFVNVVPDYLIVQGTPVTRLGPIFSAACNDHDRCYGTYPSDKTRCDEDLRGAMVRVIYERFSPTQQYAYGNYVVDQADLYSNVLQTAAKSISLGFFNAGQKSGACRAVATEAAVAGCID